MSKKKIEPTEAMVEAGASYAWEETNPGILGWNSISEHHKKGCRRDARAVLAAALNHPDARGLFADEDDRPWEPLNGRAPRVGEEIRRDRYGITSIAVVGRVDRTGDPWTAEGALIGMLSHGTWYVRRTVQELPMEPGSVIVPADGHEHIEATLCGQTFYARTALLSWSGWYAAWRAGDRKCGFASPEEITPGTWRVDDQ